MIQTLKEFSESNLSIDSYLTHTCSDKLIVLTKVDVIQSSSRDRQIKTPHFVQLSSVGNKPLHLLENTNSHIVLQLDSNTIQLLEEIQSRLWLAITESLQFDTKIKLCKISETIRLKKSKNFYYTNHSPKQISVSDRKGNVWTNVKFTGFKIFHQTAQLRICCSSLVFGDC